MHFLEKNALNKSKRKPRRLNDTIIARQDSDDKYSFSKNLTDFYNFSKVSIFFVHSKVVAESRGGKYKSFPLLKIPFSRPFFNVFFLFFRSIFPQSEGRQLILNCGLLLFRVIKKATNLGHYKTAQNISYRETLLLFTLFNTDRYKNN